MYVCLKRTVPTPRQLNRVPVYAVRDGAMVRPRGGGKDLSNGPYKEDWYVRSHMFLGDRIGPHHLGNIIWTDKMYPQSHENRREISPGPQLK